MTFIFSSTHLPCCCLSAWLQYSCICGWISIELWQSLILGKAVLVVFCCLVCCLTSLGLLWLSCCVGQYCCVVSLVPLTWYCCRLSAVLLLYCCLYVVAGSKFMVSFWLCLVCDVVLFVTDLGLLICKCTLIGFSISTYGFGCSSTCQAFCG